MPNNLEQIASRPLIVTIAGRNIGPDPWGPLGTGNEIGAALSRGRGASPDLTRCSVRHPIKFSSRFCDTTSPNLHVDATCLKIKCTSTRVVVGCFKIDLVCQCWASPEL